MLEQGVAVCLCLYLGEPVKVVDVDVDEDPEHPGQDLLAGLLEVPGEVDVGVAGKDGLVEDLVLDPVEQAVVVVGG